MDYEVIRSIFSDFGWPGILYATFVGAAKIGWDWYTKTKWPAEREDRKIKLDADQTYRLAHTAKMDRVAEETSDMKAIVKENTEVLRVQQTEFGHLTTEIGDLVSTLKEHRYDTH